MVHEVLQKDFLYKDAEPRYRMLKEEAAIEATASPATARPSAADPEPKREPSAGHGTAFGIFED